VPLLLVVFGGLLTITTLRTGLSRGAQWAIVGVGFGLPFPVVIAALAGLLPSLPSTPGVLLTLLAVYGVAWLIVGGLLLLGGGHRRPTSASPTGPTEVAA
jgi:threonine/homoserine/homoserine lactone efflux protein